MVTGDPLRGLALVDVRGQAGFRHDADLSCLLCGEFGLSFHFYDQGELGYALFGEHYVHCPAKPSGPITVWMTWPDGRPTETYEFDPRSRRAAGILLPR